MKVNFKKVVKNAIGNNTIQSVSIDDEDKFEDGETWAVVVHDSENLSMSLENLRNLKKSIESALLIYDKKF